MNRRAFFGLLAGGLAAALDPERALWVPGRKLISIPPAPALITPPELARIVLSMLRHNLEYQRTINELYSAQMDAIVYKPGSGIDIRRPRRFAT